MKKALSVLGICIAFTAIGFWGLNTYMASKGVEWGFHGKLAMGLGLFFTTLVGFGLMALLFFSARSGHDDQVHGLIDDEDQN